MGKDVILISAFVLGVLSVVFILGAIGMRILGFYKKSDDNENLLMLTVQVKESVSLSTSPLALPSRPSAT